jgi:transposase
MRRLPAGTVPPDKAELPLRTLVEKELRISMDGAYFLFCGAPQNRKGIDSLAQLCREKLAADPFSGCLFIFRSRRGTAIKLLAYDGQGFWLATN